MQLARSSARLGTLIVLSSLSAGLAAHPQSPTTETQTRTLHASSDLVVEEIAVLDAQGKPRHGLQASQFTILEDGKPQVISSFEEHTSAEAVSSVVAMPKLAPDVFTNYTTAPEQGPVNVILIDTLNTPLQSQAYLHAQLNDFVHSMKPGTRVAIFGMSRELHLLQGFTSNPELLKAALNAKKGVLRASPLLDNSVSGDLGPDSTLSDMVAAGGNTPAIQEEVAQVQQFEAEQQTFELQMRAQYTLDALNQLARYLSALPGRKNLIWFSGSFPIDILPDGDLGDPFAAMGDSEDEFRETVTLMARSHVAVFPVDARGLMVNGNMNAENSGAKYADDSRKLTKDTTAFFDQTTSEHSTMLQMADNTGGKAFLNTNGLKDAVAKAIDLGSNYYTISYYPTGHKWDGNFHSVSVKVTEPKLKLSYRIGYYADDPQGPPSKAIRPIFGATQLTPATDPSESAHIRAMRAAMLFGAPEPTQIIMKVRVLPIGDANENTLAEGNVADPKTKGPYRRYSVDYAADARHVQFVPNPDGTFKATCEFAVLVYDDQGVLVNSLSRTAVANVDEGHKALMIKTGMHMHQEISAPTKGHYWLRVGIHDRAGDGMGAVELNLDNVHPASATTSGTATAR